VFPFYCILVFVFILRFHSVFAMQANPRSRAALIGVRLFAKAKHASLRPTREFRRRPLRGILRNKTKVYQHFAVFPILLWFSPVFVFCSNFVGVAATTKIGIML
jgi:hypothetical protein